MPTQSIIDTATNTTSSARVKNPDPWALPDLPLHKPNCNAITDDQIRSTILGKWPVGQDGVVRIPYTYGGESYYKLFGVKGLRDILSYNPKPLDETGTKEYINNIKENIEKALGSWESASNGKIEFVHQIKMDKNTPGISFFLGDEKALDKNYILGYTLFGDPKNGYFNNVAIVYRDSKKFWDFNNLSASQIASNIRTTVHEIGHGLGEGHYFDVDEILEALKKIKDGVFCSVMPYQFVIQTPQNVCEGENCNPSHATLPGPLDVRFVNINYNDNMENVCVNNFIPETNSNNTITATETNNNTRTLSFDLNFLNTFASTILLGATQKSIHEFIANLQIDGDQKILSDMKANLLSDICFVAAMMAAKRSPIEINGYIINAAMKYLPECASNSIPTPVKAALESPYTGVALFAASLLWNVYQGGGVLPVVCEMAAASYADKIGSFIGEKAAKGINYVGKKLGEAALAYWPESEAETDTDLLDDPKEVEEVKVADEIEDNATVTSTLEAAAKSARSMFANSFNMFKAKPKEELQKEELQKDTRDEADVNVQDNIALEKEAAMSSANYARP